MSTTAIRIRQTAVEEDDAAIGSAADLSGKKKETRFCCLNFLVMEVIEISGA